MERYEVDSADENTEKLDRLLREGWEPFAVTSERDFPDRYHLRRPVSA